MTDADEERAKIFGVAEELLQAVRRGENAFGFAEKVPGNLQRAYDDLEQVRLQMVNAIERMDNVSIPKLEEMAEESAAAANALNRVQNARRIFAEYVTSVAMEQETLARLIRAHQMSTDTQLLEAGQSLRQAAEAMAHYGNTNL